MQRHHITLANPVSKAVRAEVKRGGTRTFPQQFKMPPGIISSTNRLSSRKPV